MKSTPHESEIKIPVTDLEPIRLRLVAEQAEVEQKTAREINLLLDTENGQLTENGQALRIRTWAGRSILTYKGPVTYRGPIKIREELETCIGDSALVEALFAHLGFRPWIRYEKDREAWRLQGALITLDHTPMGDFIEIEGPEVILEDLARRLELDVEQAVTGSYVSLWQTYRRVHDLGPDMVFDE